MVKSKASSLGKLPKEQRCQFLIGPINSWFMPNISDIWTQPKETRSKTGEIKLKVSQDDIMDCEQNNSKDNPSLSYFIYGSIGCFCYGEIHRLETNNREYQVKCQRSDSGHSISASINRLIDIKEDKSRVSCVRFLKASSRPLAMVLTENGSFIIHDCLSSENLVSFKKSELISKYVQKFCRQEEPDLEHCVKKTKFNVTQQINSCLWVNPRNAFLGISLLKEKTILVLWLKLNELDNSNQALTKEDFILSHEKLELDLPQYSSPICCMESAMIDSNTCLVAVATDDGIITVARVDFEQGIQTRRVIKLARHNDQISSMSFFVGNTKKFPSGLLASVSRNGLVLVWDIENEFYFADYQASSESWRGGSKINWFALSFIWIQNSKQISLAVSNSDNSLTMLDLPENTRSKTRLKDNKDARQQKKSGEQTLRHHALLFNIVYDPNIETILTTSLDGNHILWDCRQKETSNQGAKKEGHSLELKALYLLPSMTNNSRTHMLRHSPIKEDLLGVALGKAGLRFYKITDNPMNRRFDMSSSCSIISRKITKSSLTPTSLAWHPGHEYRLAIGTLEGKVLRVDITPGKAAMIEAELKDTRKLRITGDHLKSFEAQADDDIFGVEYTPFERRSQEDLSDYGGDHISVEKFKSDGVYSLCWGPNPSCPQDVTRLAIYAVGSISHRLFIYYNKKENSDKLTNYLDEFADDSIPEAIDEASEVTWKSSMDLMALGTTNGRVIITRYGDQSSSECSDSKLFKKLAVIQGPFGGNYIQCLVWHPTADQTDMHYYYLAVASNESPAYIFNLKEMMLVADVKSHLRIEDSGTIERCENPNMKSVTANIVSNHVYKLDAHEKSISDIQWNPHIPNQIATASFDRFCYVWSLDDLANVPADMPIEGSVQIIAKFTARDRLFTLEWSLVDPDLIFTSGHDSTIWAWRPTENIGKSSGSNF